MRQAKERDVFAAALPIARIIKRARALPSWLCAISFVISCRGYDASLLTKAQGATLTCGDGHIDPYELCDPGIADGQPDACPNRCADLHDPCVKNMLVGTDCRQQCLAVAALAIDGSECCTNGKLTNAQCQPGARDAAKGPGAAGGTGGGIIATDAEGTAPSNRGSTNPIEPTTADGGTGQPMPIHRYSFGGRGSVVADSVGDADGAVVGTQLKGDGQLTLVPGANTYVTLPPHLLSKLHSATLEAWITWSGDLTRRYERIFEFGNANAGDAGMEEVTSSFLLSPNYDNRGLPRVAFRARTGDIARVSSALRIPSRARAHIAVVIDGDDRALQLYINARLAGAAQLNAPLSMLDDAAAFLGRSLYTNDPNFDGSFDEFRIYDVALSANEIEQSDRNGPSRL